MDLFYKLLGVAAGFGSNDSREHLNLIPMSVYPLAFLVVLPLAAWGMWGEKQEPKDPTPAPMRTLARDEYHGPKYVSLRGQFVSADVVERTTSGDDQKVTKEVFAIFEGLEAEGALVVELEPGELQHQESGPTTLTGMLRPLEPSVSGELSERKGKKIPVSPSQYLDVGAEPKRPGIVPYILLALTVPLLFLAGAMACSWVIFRPDGGLDAPELPSQAEPSGTALDLRATGRFFLEGRTRESFYCVPVMFTSFDDGSLGLYAHVDASIESSVNFTPVGRTERSGYWLLWIGRGTVKNIQRGRQYMGWDEHIALRFRFQSGYSRIQESAVVIFHSRQDREEMIAILQSVAIPEREA